MYDNFKYLIYKEYPCVAQKIGNHKPPSTPADDAFGRPKNPWLSLPALDNLVDNSEQALYDSFKSLIYKETSCAAQKTGSAAWIKYLGYSPRRRPSDRSLFHSYQCLPDKR